MDVAARVTQGQVALPEAVRDILGIEEGDEVVFRVEGRRVILARTPNLLDLAGSISVPADKLGVPWEEVRRQAHEAWARESL